MPPPVNRGDPLKIRAEDWNRLLRMMRDEVQRVFRRVNVGVGRSGLVRVKNSTGAALQRFGIGKLDGVVISEGTNSDEFKNGPTFSLVDAEEDELFAITVDAIADGEFGYAFLFGVTPVLVEITDAAHKFAAPKADNTKLESAADSGPVEILYKEAATGATVWCLVRFGGTGAAINFVCAPVRLTSHVSGNEYLGTVYRDGPTVTPPAEDVGVTVKLIEVSPSNTLATPRWLMTAMNWPAIESDVWYVDHARYYAEDTP